MKLNVERVLGWVQAFDFPRPSRSSGERRAAGILAEGWETCGWTTVRCRVGTEGRTRGFLVLLSVALLLLTYSIWLALRLALPGLPVLAPAGLTLGALALVAAMVGLAIGGDARTSVREGLWARPSSLAERGMVNVLASWPVDAATTARVLFISHLDATVPGAAREGGCWAVLLGGLLVLAHSGLKPAWSAWVRVALALGVVVFLSRTWLRPGRTCPGDNRSGLAVLAALAASLPARMHERVEIRIAAVSGSAAGQLGALALADQVRRLWPAKPTLVINLDAPGLGSALVLIGRGQALAEARRAAQDLWLPHRVARWPWRALDHRPFRFRGLESVSLAGDRDGRKIDPAGLAAAVQLATEIALRWSRQGAVAAQGASASRSAQKPG